MSSFLSAIPSLSPPTVEFTGSDYAWLMIQCDQQVHPVGAPDGALYLSCNEHGEAWVVSRRGYNPPGDRRYVHGHVSAVDELVALMLHETRDEDISGGRFYVTEIEAVRTLTSARLASVVIRSTRDRSLRLIL